MGSQQSSTETVDDVEIDGSKCGFRVLDVQEGSPAESCGFVCYFDFIVHANGYRLAEENDNTFVQVIGQSENKLLHLTVYNCKDKSTREVSFVPRRGWGGAGLLGLTIKFDTYEDSDSQLVHVLEVNADSPADKAGLIPFNDFILGTPEYVIQDLDYFYELVRVNMNHEIEIYVYSVVSDSVRRTVITPKEGWGGEGVLGCNVGHGYLHRFPGKSSHTRGRSDAGEHGRAIVDADFLIGCGRVEQFETPFGPGAAVIPFPTSAPFLTYDPEEFLVVRLSQDSNSGDGQPSDGQQQDPQRDDDPDEEHQEGRPETASGGLKITVKVRRSKCKPAIPAKPTALREETPPPLPPKPAAAPVNLPSAVPPPSSPAPDVATS